MKHLFKRNAEGEGRVYLWASAETVNGVKRLWRYGRFHLRATGMGRKRKWLNAQGERPVDYGKRGDFGLNIEWSLFFPRYRFGWGWTFKWGTNGSETTPDIALHFGFLGNIYISFQNLVPYRWLERTKLDDNGQRMRDYDTRVFSFNVSAKEIRFECWQRQGHWSRTDPWWYSGKLNYRDFFFGRIDHSEERTAEGECKVPMPEKVYDAKWHTTQYTRRYRRPLGRLRDRIFGPHIGCSTRVEVEGGIIVPGKGENSWDCGDDHIHSVGGANLPAAIAQYVQSALSARARHGGAHMSVPA